MNAAVTLACIDCGVALPPSYPSLVCARCLWAGDAAVEETPAVERPGMKSLRVPGHDVMEEIARGGMGVVYRAKERETQRTVALKMLRPRLADEEGMRERFRMEACAVAALEHPSILPVYRVDEANDMPFFTMKLAGGGTLAARREALRGDWRGIAELIRTMAEALQYAHQRGVLHRDIKPANILFDDAGKPYLTDFGLVKLIDSVSELTGSQSFLGTPHYSSPEVASSKPGAATVASDVWSLGAVLYELLAGQLPFDADGLMPLLRRITDEPPAPLPPAGEGKESVPRDLRVIALKCLQKEPVDRYPSAEALAGDLRAWLEGRPITARPASIPERVAAWTRRNPLLAAMAASLVISLSLLSLVLWRENRASQQAAAKSRTAEMESKRSETAAQEAEATALLQETRARLRDGQWVARKLSIDAVLRSQALRPSGAARDVLISLLALPELERTGAVPYTANRPVYFSGDLTRYVTVEKNATAIRDTATGNTLFVIPETSSSNWPPGPLSRDGKRLVLRTPQRVMVWGTETEKPQELAVLPPGRGFPDFSADGSKFGLGTYIAGLNAGKPPSTLTVDAPQYHCRAVSPDGKYLLLGHLELTRLRLYDSASGELVQEYEAAGGNMVHCVAWAADGRTFYTGMVDGKIARWPLREATPEWIIPAHTDGVDVMALFDDDQHLISQSRDGHTKIWDLRTLMAVAVLPWQGLRVTASPDGRHLAVDNAFEKKSILYRFTPPPVCTLIRLPASLVANSYLQGTASVIPHPDNSGFAVTAGYDLHLLDREGTLKQTVRCGRCDGLASDPLGKGYVRNSTFPRAGRMPQHRVFRCPLDWTGAWDDRSLALGLWEKPSLILATNPVTRRLVMAPGELMFAEDPAHGETLAHSNITPLQLPKKRAVTAMIWDATGKHFAWAAVDSQPGGGRTIFVQRPGNIVPIIIPASLNISALDFTADGTGLLAGDARNVTCFDLPAGTVRWTLAHERPPERDARAIVQIAVAKDSGAVAVALTPETVSLIDPRTGHILRSFQHPTNRIVRAIGLSPDGTRLMVVGSYIAHLWLLDRTESELDRFGMGGPM